MTEILRSPAFLAIVVGEILFWVLIASGMATRYLLRLPRLGAVLLAGTIVVDIAVLVTAVIDLRNGGTPSAAHGLAAIYVGFSIAFGPYIVRWADVRAAHRWADGPAPAEIPRAGPERMRHEWRLFARWLVAAAIAAATLGLVLIVGGPAAAGLASWFGTLGTITVVWLIGGPIWCSGRTASNA